MKKSYIECNITSVTAFKLAVIVLISICMTACAGQSSSKHVFWPAPPDLPRVQFLKAIKDSNDVVETKKLSLLNLGERGEDYISLSKPYGIAASNGKIYVCDTVQAEVVIIDLPNKKMSRLAGNVNAGRLRKPINVALDARQNIYVADTSRMEVLQYAPDGSYLRSFGTGMNINPVDVSVEDNFIYILDKASSQVRIFDSESGEVLKSIGKDSDPQKGLSIPTNLASDGKGALFVSNFGNGRIIKLDRDGNFLMGHGKLGLNFGEFGRPRGISVDEDGLVYVVDAAAQHVQIFDDKMRLLMFFGTPGTAGSLNIPAGIAVSSENLEYYQSLAEPGFKLEKVLFVVSQVGEHLVNIYGLGKKQGVDYDADVKRALSDLQKKTAEIKELQRKAQEDKERKEKAPATGPGSSQTAPVR